jgi:hypothetical protein
MQEPSAVTAAARPSRIAAFFMAQSDLMTGQVGNKRL